MSAGGPDEFEIIAKYFSWPSARSDVVLGIGDDAALLTVPAGRQLVAAMDTLVEGIHFPAGTAARDIGYRALAVNLSDIAAMGADPAWTLLSLSLPRSDDSWLEGFAAGFHELAVQSGVALVGGDTVRGPLVISVQILGHVATDGALTRSGARPGDAIYVSGIPGEAAAGLAVIQQRLAGSPATRFLRQRFLRPEPRVALGQSVRMVASAAMDVSDGLLADLGKLCAASGCSARIDLERLPASAAMRSLFAASACERFALAGGDDYELLLTVAPGRESEFHRRLAGETACTRIGEVVAVAGAGDTVQCCREGRPVSVEAAGFDHFAPGTSA